jgi:hypothetical protein
VKPSFKPCARKDRLVVETLPEEMLVYDLDRDRAHCLNETAAMVWRHCDGKRTSKEIAESLSQKLKHPVDEKIVWLALDQLKRNYLLQDAQLPPSPLTGLNRREVVRALGLTAAFAIPVVASIVAPTPAQAATCLPGGATCSSSAQCCSGSCDGVCIGG